jgi:hypothetical protein
MEQVISVQDFDQLVKTTYNRPYSFQQQDDCKPRQRVGISVPDYVEDYENDTVPEVVNHPHMGVSFAAWLARDPKQKLSNPDDQADYCTEIWWERNFYPNVTMVVNDLHEKGLLDAGEYFIDIDW